MHYGVLFRLWNKQDEQMFHLVTANTFGMIFDFFGAGYIYSVSGCRVIPSLHMIWTNV